MASQLDPSMGMDPNLDPSMDRSLQQEEEDQYDDEGIEVAVDDEQDDPDPGVNHAVTNLACCNIVWQDEGCTSVLMILQSMAALHGFSCGLTHLYPQVGVFMAIA